MNLGIKSSKQALAGALCLTLARSSLSLSNPLSRKHTLLNGVGIAENFYKMSEAVTGFDINMKQGWHKVLKSTGANTATLRMTSTIQ